MASIRGQKQLPGIYIYIHNIFIYIYKIIYIYISIIIYDICVCFSRHTTSAQMPHGANEARRCPRPRVFQPSTPLAQAFAANPAGDVICSWAVAEGHSSLLFLLFFCPNHSILPFGPLLPVFSMRYSACWSGLFLYHNYSKLKS